MKFNGWRMKARRVSASTRQLAIYALAVILHSSLFILHCSAQVITTIAGTQWVFRGSGGAATQAALGELAGVTVDPAGNVFVADSGNNMVMKISTSGILTVVAGNGTFGFSGDGGPATSAGLSLPPVEPAGVAVDSAGNLYIADTESQRIRKVSPGGIITTVAGNGQEGHSGDGGPAIAAALREPHGVAVDAAGNLYISEVDAFVRKVNTAGIISTVAGSGCFPSRTTTCPLGDGGPAIRASLGSPLGLAVDAAGNLYIADGSGNHRIRKVSPSGIITTVAGGGQSDFSGDGGPATSASLHQPSGVAVDAGGNLYIADTENQRIRKVSASGIISTVAGRGNMAFAGDGGPGVNASLAFPSGVAVDTAGNLYIADSLNHRIRKLDLGGTITTAAGGGVFKFSGDGGPATRALLNKPLAVALDATGNLYHSDLGARVRRVSPGGTITTVAGNGIVGFSGDGGPATSASLAIAFALAADAAGNLYIADDGNNSVRKVTPAGTITTVAGNGQRGSFGTAGDGGPATSVALHGAGGLAVDAAGNLYISDEDAFVRKVNTAGIISTVAGSGCLPSGTPTCPLGDGGPANRASLDAPHGLAVDAAGNLYIADTHNQRIRKVSPTGTITTVAGNGQKGFSGDGGPANRASLSLEGFGGVAVDTAGNLYIADSGNSRIRKVSASGVISTVAGNGSFSFSGDCGPATAAALAFPFGVAVDRAGNLYIADTFSDHIRKVSFAPPSLPSMLPTLPPDSVVNAASFRPAADPNGAIAPGANVAVFGTELAFDTQVALSTPLASQLLDSCVVFTVGNQIFPAPLFFVSSGQINAQVPFELPPGTVSVQVRRGEQLSAAQPLNVARVSPGIFTLSQQGSGAGMILHAESFELVSESTPARPGEFLIIFGTGLGAVQPPVPSGQPAPGGPRLAQTVSAPLVNIGGIPAPVTFSGLAPGFVGLYQVNVQVPMEVPAGTQPVQIIMEGVPSNTVTIEVAQ